LWRVFVSTFFVAEQREKRGTQEGKRSKGLKRGEENESIPSRSAKGHAKIEEEEEFFIIQKRQRPHSQHPPRKKR
jgi:hypothetical protein